MSSFALILMLAFQAAPVQSQTVDPREPPQALPEGSYFPPSMPVPPQIVAPATVPVSYLPSDMSSLGLNHDDYIPLLWADSELILWRIKKGNQPFPLVSTGTASSFGIIGQPGTSTPNAGKFDYNTIVGSRLTTGVWFNESHSIGIEGGFTCGP